MEVGQVEDKLDYRVGGKRILTKLIGRQAVPNLVEMIEDLIAHITPPVLLPVDLHNLNPATALTDAQFRAVIDLIESAESAIARYLAQSRETLERVGILAKPVQEPCRLIVAFDVIGFILEECLVNRKRPLSCARIAGVFLVKPSEIQVSAGKAGRGLNGAAKIRFGGCEVFFLRLDHAQEIK